MKNLKYLFLLALLSITTLQAQTRSEIQVQIETIATGVPNTALKIRNVLGVLANGTAQTGDVKEIDVATAYIAANFDATGLGINERLGWAICNGNNGTRNRGGRVSIQYNASYPTLGATGGSENAVLVSHNHTVGTSPNDVLGYVTAKSSSTTGGTPIVTSTVGESGTGKNMQPFIVSLFIQKLPE